jgi:hypothetical protein
MMKSNGHCEWCGAAWETTHVGPIHFRNREMFMQGYYKFSVDRCAPALLQLERLQQIRGRQDDDLPEEKLQVGRLRSVDQMRRIYLASFSALCHSLPVITCDRRCSKRSTHWPHRAQPCKRR